MRGIILAGGTGSRLYPLTKVTNKCLLPVGREPMIFRMIDLLKRSDITDIMIVTGLEHMGQVVSVLGSGSDLGCSITYRVQDVADGIAAALKLCRDFVRDDKFVVLLGDNIFSDHEQIKGFIKEFESSSGRYRLFGKKVKDPERFGVPVYKDGIVVDIVEKPKFPPTNIAIVGLYCYSPEVFQVIDSLKISGRGEYEISDVNSWLVKNSIGDVVELKCEWIDAGTHESYKRANETVWRLK